MCTKNLAVVTEGIVATLYMAQGGNVGALNGMEEGE
jgi:hypothetical protein